MATAVAEPRRLDDLVDEMLIEISDATQPLSAILPAKDPERAQAVKVLGSAWVKGFIEIGQRRWIGLGTNYERNETTMVNPKSRGQTLVIESERVDCWSGDKRTWHKSFRDLMTEINPAITDEYIGFMKYIPAVQQPGKPAPEKGSMDRVPITRQEAEKLVDYHVRLTDKGLAQLRA